MGHPGNLKNKIVKNIGNPFLSYKSIQQFLSNKATLFAKKIVATLKRWPLVRGRSKYIESSSGKDFWPYWRGWPLR